MKHIAKTAAAALLVLACCGTARAEALLLERAGAVFCHHVPIGEWERAAQWVKGTSCSSTRGLVRQVERHLAGLGPTVPRGCRVEEVEGPGRETYYSVQCRLHYLTWMHGRWVSSTAFVEIDLEGN